MSADYAKLKATIAETLQNWDMDWLVEWNERAAIKEACGGMERTRAEVEAFFECQRMRGEQQRKTGRAA